MTSSRIVGSSSCREPGCRPSWSRFQLELLQEPHWSRRLGTGPQFLKKETQVMLSNKKPGSSEDILKKNVSKLALYTIKNGAKIWCFQSLNYATVEIPSSVKVARICKLWSAQIFCIICLLQNFNWATQHYFKQWPNTKLDSRLTVPLTAMLLAAIDVKKELR